MNDTGVPAFRTIDLRQIVDHQGINGYRFRILFLILLAMFADSYDGSSISYAAPMITEAWHLDRGAMGPVFGINIAGILLGGGCMGLLGDWIGRRTALIIGIFTCALATLGTVLATDLTSLIAWRFGAGLGVGAILPLCLVIANEYAPRRIRATVIALIFLAFTVGGMGIGGIVKATLGPLLGWRAIFYFGGAVTFLIAVLLVIGLPESLKYLFVKKPHSPEISRIARKLQPSLVVTPDTIFTWPEEDQAEHKIPYHMIFSEGRRKVTLALWLTYFCLQMNSYAMSFWLPTLLGSQGLPDLQIASAMAIYGTCGQIGATISARFIDRFGVIVHAALPLLGVALVFLVSSLTSSGSVFIAAIAATGFSINGSLIGMSIMAGFFYPTAVRSTGVGMAIFVSRFGSVLGPVVIGILLSHGATIQAVFRYSALPLTVATIGMFLLGIFDRPRFRRENEESYKLTGVEQENSF